MSLYKASIFNYIFNSVNTIILIVNGIIMVPVYFKYMPVSVYGAWLASGNLVAMIGILESGFSSVITQKMAFALVKGEELNYRRLGGANILSALFISTCIFIIGMIFSPFLTKLINVPSGYERDILIAYVLSLLSASVAILVSLFGAFPQVWQETKRVGEINTCVNIAGIAIMIICLMNGYGVVALGIGYLSRSLLNLIFQGLWIFPRMKENFGGKLLYNKQCLTEVIKDCFYPFLSKLSSAFMFNSQSFIIAVFLNPTLAAFYDITSKLATVMYGFASMTNGSFFALFSLTFAKKNQEETNKVLINITHFFALFINTILLYSICFTEPVVYYWVGLEKYGGTLLLVLVVLSLYMNQCQKYFNNILYTGGYIKKSSIIDIMCLLLYIILLLTSISFLHQYAIPVAMYISSFVFLGFYIRLIKKYMEINLTPIIKTFMPGLFLAILFILLDFIINIDYIIFMRLVIYFTFYTLLYVGVLIATDNSLRNIIKNRKLI